MASTTARFEGSTLSRRSFLRQNLEKSLASKKLSIFHLRKAETIRLFASPFLVRVLRRARKKKMTNTPGSVLRRLAVCTCRRHRREQVRRIPCKSTIFVDRAILYPRASRDCFTLKSRIWAVEHAFSV